MYCVYKHTNKNNGKVYIGITGQQPELRWKNGEGYVSNQYFYRAIQKNGWDGFEHEILEEGLTKEQALNKEKEYIALYKSNCRRYRNPTYGYNATDGGEGASGYGRPVNQYSLEGIYLHTWYSIKEAAEATNLTYTNIVACCSGKSLRAGEYRWQYWDDSGLEEDIESYYVLTGFANPREVEELKKLNFEINRENQKILQYSIFGDFIKEWSSIHEAALFYQTPDSNICAVCQGRSKSARGYVWRYKHNENKNFVSPVYTKIIQYKNGKVIGVFSTATEAQEKTGINNSHISAVCNGKRKKAGDCIWEKRQYQI